MSDKKVERSFRSVESERPISPGAAKKQGVEPESPTAGRAPVGGEDKTALLEKFREREERYRREHDPAADQGASESDSEPSSGEG